MGSWSSQASPKMNKICPTKKTMLVQPTRTRTSSMWRISRWLKASSPVRSKRASCSWRIPSGLPTERKAILESFRNGRYLAIVTTRVLNEGVDVPEAKVAMVLGGTASAREYIQRLGRILRKQENKTALLYEIIVRGTIEEGISYRRRRKVEYRVEKDVDR